MQPRRCITPVGHVPPPRFPDPELWMSEHLQPSWSGFERAVNGSYAGSPLKSLLPSRSRPQCVSLLTWRHLRAPASSPTSQLRRYAFCTRVQQSPASFARDGWRELASSYNGAAHASLPISFITVHAVIPSALLWSVASPVITLIIESTGISGPLQCQFGAGIRAPDATAASAATLLSPHTVQCSVPRLYRAQEAYA